MKGPIKRAARVVAIVILSLFAIALAIAFLSLPGCSSFDKDSTLDSGCLLRLTGKLEGELKLACDHDIDIDIDKDKAGTIGGATIGG